MKRNTIIALYTTLMGVKLNKMSEEMTDAILANTIAASEVNDTFAKVQEELRKRTIETIDKERREAYDRLSVKADALSGKDKAAIYAVMRDNFADIEKAKVAYSKALRGWLDKDAKVELEQVDRKEFLKGIKEADQSLTPADVEILAPIFKGYNDRKVDVDAAELDELLAE